MEDGLNKGIDFGMNREFAVRMYNVNQGDFSSWINKIVFTNISIFVNKGISLNDSARLYLHIRTYNGIRTYRNAIIYVS